MDTSDKVHIFLDEAGFGKTTYMTWLAWYFVRHQPASWVFRLNAHEYSYDFERIMKEHRETLDNNETVRILFQLIHLALFIPNPITKPIEETAPERRKASPCQGIQRVCLLDILFEYLRYVVGEIQYIPLFFRMVLDILESQLKEYVSFTNCTILPSLFHELQPMLGLTRMLEAFVNQKLTIANHDKSGSCNTASFIAQRLLDAEHLNESRKYVLSLLGIFAIIAPEYKILSQREQKQCEEYLRDITNGRDKSGIIEGVQAGVPLFIHRLLAEYFAARWLFDNMDRHEVKLFLQSKSLLEYQHFAVRRLFDEIVVRDEDGNDSPAFLAVICGDNIKLKQDIALGITVHQKTDMLGRTPLHLAVQYRDDIEIYDMLIGEKDKNGSTLCIDAKDNLRGWSALDYAFSLFNSQAIEYLLRKNATINVQTLLEQFLEDHQSALFEMLSLTVKEVMNFTHDVDKYKPLYGHSAKQIEAMHMLCDKVVIHIKENRTEWFEANRANLLLTCAKCDSVLLLRSLLASGIELNTSCNHHAIIKKAIERRSLHVIGFLIREHNIDISVATVIEQISSLLKYCAERKYENWFFFFLDLYCSKLNLSEHTPCNASDSSVLELLFHVLAYGSTQMVHRLIDKIAMTIDVQLIFAFLKDTTGFSSYRNTVQVPRCVLDRVENIYEPDKEGRNLLHLSAQLGQFAIVKCLIKYKQFDPILVNPRNGWNAFHYCVSKPLQTNAHNGNEEQCHRSFQYMMKGSAITGIHAIDVEERNVFHLAIINKHFSSAKLILEHFVYNIPSEMQSEQQQLYISKSRLKDSEECDEFLRYLNVLRGE
uniref:ANK_REP_REGION domain-containing protein n=1 Tax=Anopheles albimanus TaxID=7167 RepID=A0A182F1W9_ANOAL